MIRSPSRPLACSGHTLPAGQSLRFVLSAACKCAVAIRLGCQVFRHPWTSAQPLVGSSNKRGTTIARMRAYLRTAHAPLKARVKTGWSARAQHPAYVQLLARRLDHETAQVIARLPRSSRLWRASALTWHPPKSFRCPRVRAEALRMAGALRRSAQPLKFSVATCAGRLTWVAAGCAAAAVWTVAWEGT